MSGFIPNVLVFGHSFVRRLNDDLNNGFDSRAKQNFNLAASGVYVSLKGTGGRTVDRCLSMIFPFSKAANRIYRRSGNRDERFVKPFSGGGRFTDRRSRTLYA